MISMEQQYALCLFPFYLRTSRPDVHNPQGGNHYPKMKTSLPALERWYYSILRTARTGVREPGFISPVLRIRISRRSNYPITSQIHCTNDHQNRQLMLTNFDSDKFQNREATSSPWRRPWCSLHAAPTQISILSAHVIWARESDLWGCQAAGGGSLVLKWEPGEIRGTGNCQRKRAGNLRIAEPCHPNQIRDNAR